MNHSARSISNITADNAALPGWGFWLFPRDSDRIARRFLVTLTGFFLVGLGLAILVRLELLSGHRLLMSAETFSRLFSMHGIFMLFLVGLPAIPGVLGSLLLPRLIGARNFAFPALMVLSWYLYLLAGLLLLVGSLAGGIQATWTLAPPFVSESAATPALVTFAGIALVCASLLCLAVNTLATVYRLRGPGVGWKTLPQLGWGLFLGAWALLLSLPGILSLLVLLSLGVLLEASPFAPELGGDVELYRRLFWAFSRPLFVALVLPALGVVGEIVEDHVGIELRRDPWIRVSLLGIFLLGFLGAGSHWVTGGGWSALTLLSSLANYLNVFFFALLMARWARALWLAPMRFSPGLAFAFASLLLVLAGGLSGLLLAGAGSGPPLHATVFVVGHLHFLLAGAVLGAYLGGLHQWWDLLGRRGYLEGAGFVGAVVLVVGVFATFFPQFLLGVAGLPRRLPVYPQEFQVLQVLSSAGASLLVIAYVLPMIYLLLPGTERRRP